VDEIDPTIYGFEEKLNEIDQGRELLAEVKANAEGRG